MLLDNESIFFLPLIDCLVKFIKSIYFNKYSFRKIFLIKNNLCLDNKFKKYLWSLIKYLIKLLKFI